MATKNFAIGTLANPYDAAAVSIALVAGQGARFGGTPFMAVWWNSTDYGRPSDDPNVEIVQVTGVAVDTLTIVRAQEGTLATVKNLGGKTYKIFAGLTAGMWDSTFVALAGGVMTGPLETPAYRDTIGALVYAGALALDFAAGGAWLLSLTGAITFSTANRAIGRMFKVYVFCDGTDRALTFPSGGSKWHWLSDLPASITAGKAAVLSLECTGPNDSDIFAVWAPDR